MIDPHLKWLLRMQLKALHQQVNNTMIYVTHDQTEALTFADKVVVMHDGYVVQIGTPQELFERPAHTFVGYFIGSPGMNVLPACIDGKVAHVGDRQIPLPAHYQLAQQDGLKTEIGIRPEFAHLSREAHEHSLPVQIKRIEDIGRYKIARADFLGHDVNVVIPEGMPVTHDYQQLSFDTGQINVYANDWLVEREVA
ncbi:MAG: hypothetical protein R3E95_17720 [Thiolinea sp.]